MLPLAECEEVIKRHEKVALSWSGGKDSTAVLFYLRPFWDLLTVYWLNTGDCPVETVLMAARVKERVPRFVEVNSDSLADINAYGFPVEAVPESLTYAGAIVSGKQPPFLVRQRLECCWKNIMQPCLDAILADGNTLIIRGQKEGDPLRNHMLKNGEIRDGLEFLFPVDDETDQSVLSWLEIHAPEFVHTAYKLGDKGLTDCIHCTADYGDGDGIRSRYPDICSQRSAIRMHVANELIAVVNTVC